MKNAALYGIFLVLLVGAGFLYVNKVSPQTFVNDLFSKPYAYKEVQQGVTFASNDASIAEIVPVLAGKDSFILSPKMVATPGTLNSFMSQAIVQQQIVLGGHHKITTTVIRVYDTENGTWTGCQTDFGSGKQSEFISVEDCNPLLSQANSIVIGVEFPNPQKSAPLVELSANAITLFPVKQQDIPGVNFLVMRALYADASSLIGAANQVISDNNATNPSSKPKPIDSNILA